MNPRHRGHRGFTLVELLIAFSLIALITLLLFSGLRLGMRAWEGVDALIARDSEQRIARTLLYRLLAQARPLSLTWDAQRISVFSGDAAHLEFVAPLSDYVGIPGLYLLRLSLAGPEGRTLILTRWLFHPDVLAGTGEIPEWEPLETGTRFQETQGEDRDIAAGAFGITQLVASVTALEFSYFGPAKGTLDPRLTQAPEDGEWQAEWMEREDPPDAVRIHLETSERAWPDLIVRIPRPKPETTHLGIGPGRPRTDVSPAPDFGGRL